MKRVFEVMWRDVVGFFTGATLREALRGIALALFFILFGVIGAAILAVFVHYGQLLFMWLLPISAEVSFWAMMATLGLLMWFISALDRD